MGKRINRTLLNPRWWLVLPLFPIGVAVAFVLVMCQATVDLLDAAHHKFSGPLFRWVREGDRE